MTIKILLAAIGTVGLLAAGPAFAQAPAKEKPAPAAKPARTAKSLECSRQADEQKLHGKPRKAFMSKCKKA